MPFPFCEYYLYTLCTATPSKKIWKGGCIQAIPRQQVLDWIINRIHLGQALAIAVFN